MKCVVQAGAAAHLQLPTTPVAPAGAEVMSFSLFVRFGRRARTAGAASRSHTEPLEGRTLLSAGQLDPTFSGDGILLADGPRQGVGTAAVADARGATIVAGNMLDENRIPTDF